MTVLRRIVLTLVGVLGAVLCYGICQSVFAGYPQYGTDILTYIALTLIVATGAVAWVIDERRLDDDE